jgi:S-adenosylmethionine hydrolase
MTGIRVASVSPAAQARIGTRLLPRATTFCEVSPGMPFWYENANGLMEIAVNQGRADAILSLRPGTIVDVCPA